MRITYRDNKGNGYIKESHGYKESLSLVLERLAAYEDTGLTPEEIQLLKETKKPITVGQTVYVKTKFMDITVYIPCKLVRITQRAKQVYAVAGQYPSGLDEFDGLTYRGNFTDESIGGSLFLTETALNAVVAKQERTFWNYKAALYHRLYDYDNLTIEQCNEIVTNEVVANAISNKRSVRDVAWALLQ